CVQWQTSGRCAGASAKRFGGRFVTRSGSYDSRCFFFQAEDGIRYRNVTGVQTCALPISLHILLVPGIMLALIAVHLGLVWYQKHTQFPGVRKSEKNVVGVRIRPMFALQGGALFALGTGFTSLMYGLFQINPSWTVEPYI